MPPASVVVVAVASPERSMVQPAIGASLGSLMPLPLASSNFTPLSVPCGGGGRMSAPLIWLSWLPPVPSNFTLFMWYGPPLIWLEPKPGPQLEPVVLSAPVTARWPPKYRRNLHLLLVEQPEEVKVRVRVTS